MRRRTRFKTARCQRGATSASSAATPLRHMAADPHHPRLSDQAAAAHTTESLDTITQADQRWADAACSVDPGEVVARASDASALDNALPGLPAPYRAALLLHDIHALTAAQVADATNVPLGAARPGSAGPGWRSYPNSQPGPQRISEGGIRMILRCPTAKVQVDAAMHDVATAEFAIGPPGVFRASPATSDGTAGRSHDCQSNPHGPAGPIRTRSFKRCARCPGALHRRCNCVALSSPRLSTPRRSAAWSWSGSPPTRPSVAGCWRGEQVVESGRDETILDCGSRLVQAGGGEARLGCRRPAPGFNPCASSTS